MSSFTERAIMDSFLKIAAKKPVEKITVRDIVEDCAINRNTFYYHFKDIYDVMDAVLMNGNEASRESEDEEQSGFFTKSFLSVLGFYFAHREIIHNIYFSVGKERFSQPIKLYFDASIGKYFNSIVGERKVASDDLALLISFYSNGLTGMFCEWVCEGMKQDPCYLAVRVYQLMHGSAALAVENSLQIRSNIEKN